ncbi:MAG: Coenzyme F420 hydrogenase/dehydrogenase, beta subunit C-terminal domain [Candidatus Bathyarchaeota archaeon]|nr:Coenzyme F420 hydrogenase/dehydrogenase, beta subunit C-terminal domain [Candidatus Bathyarchaeota archaeon]MDH5786960.1 Coenzyme F420 hydrogenase/dehydrogenase, beta subunit C-terminal domain [Candidatus Bathyarchaeota archaeon]
MSFAKVSFEESLERNVVETGKCVGCGTCVLVCPFTCLEYKEEKPNLIKECKICGICPQVCPQYEWSWSKAENFVFGRERRIEEEFGIHCRLAVAQAKDERILKACQDGGAVTALLVFALENGLIDGAIVSEISQERPFYPTPILATSPQEILKCTGTRYSYSPSILALAEVSKQKKTAMAFVGTPCQIHAVRKMQMANLKRYAAPSKFLIGLMCSECFNYEGLMERHIHEKLGIDLMGIRKVNIKGKMLVTTSSGVQAIPLADIKQYARKSCGFCNDFSSELADISTGGLGLDGWTFIIIRTEKGEELFSKAEKAGAIKTRNANEETVALNLLMKLSKKKKASKVC